MKRMSREGVEEKTLQIKIYVYTWERMDWDMEKDKEIKIYTISWIIHTFWLVFAHRRIAFCFFIL